MVLYSQARKYTNKLLELVDDGLLDPKEIVLMAVNHMSEDDVKNMVELNELSGLFTGIDIGLDEEE